MTKATRGRYTLEFKQEAVRLVESGQSQAAAARSLGVVEQTLGNWVKAHRAGSLKGASSRPLVTAEQMEISRLRAELARVTMERDILHPTDEDLSVGAPSWEKRRRTVCYESDRSSSGGGCASLKMRAGPSEPACRSRFQTTSSCIGKEPLW
jgi:transposase